MTAPRPLHQRNGFLLVARVLSIMAIVIIASPDSLTQYIGIGLAILCLSSAAYLQGVVDYEKEGKHESAS